MKYYISDLHLGHANIIRLCNRPFTDVCQMDDTLIDNWNSVVKPDDEVYILGDLVFKATKNPVEYFKRLNGKKYLIRGNHDDINTDWYSYFEWIKPYEKIHDGDKTLILCHYPMVEWDGYFKGSIHLYGHIHNSVENQAYKIMCNIDNAYNVGADIIGFIPRTLNEVIEYNKKFNEEN